MKVLLCDVIFKIALKKMIFIIIFIVIVIFKKAELNYNITKLSLITVSLSIPYKIIVMTLLT